MCERTTHRLNILQAFAAARVYHQVRDARSKNDMTKFQYLEELKGKFAGDWLCALEILEIVEDEDIRNGVKIFTKKSVAEKNIPNLLRTV